MTSKMTEPQFVHLRAHSDFSLLQGAMNVDTLLELAAHDHMPALALSDTNNLFAAYQFSQKAIAKGIQPIIGMEAEMLYMGGDEESQIPAGESLKAHSSRLVLLVQNETGYDNLRKWVSLAYAHKPDNGVFGFTWESLSNHAEGLICLSGGSEGEIGKALQEGQKDLARQLCRTLKSLFGDRFYLEIARLQPPEQAEQQNLETETLNLSDDENIAIVATNNCYFDRADMYEAQDILNCIGGHYTIGDSQRPRLSPQQYFKSQTQMQELFADLPDALDNSIAIAKRCAYGVQKSPPRLPRYKKLNGKDEQQALQNWAEKGLQTRLKSLPPDTDLEPYHKRLEYELQIINQMGFDGYFLIVADFIQWARQKNIPIGPGRGSGAGSLVSWALTITDLDPLKYGLFFERFLNPERVSMPDFDIDFCQDLREQVIQYVQREYGHKNVAQIATFGKLQARGVLRDVGRVLQMHYMHVDRICKMVPIQPAAPVTLEMALENEPMLAAEYNSNSQVKRMIDIGKKLEGLHRHVGTHAAGIVIGDRSLDEVVPLYSDMDSSMMVTQFNMKDGENIGLVKFDFLGLKTLTVIDLCLKLIKQRQGKDIDISHIALDDEAVFEFLCQQALVGIFQLESSGMQTVTKQMQPDRLEDLIAIVALYRPGPMDNIPDYIARKHGRQKIQYLHAALEPVLRETFGIPIYQEQAMQMAQILAGYSLGGADLLRRAMGKKIKSEMDEQRQVFVAGAKQKHNIDARLANNIFDKISAFADYGFNKTHAAAYALLAYQTAYLKTHYGTEFMTASLCLDSGNTERLELLIDECRRMKIPLLPANINASEALFAIEPATHASELGGIRYGLAALKGVGVAAMQKTVAVRCQGGKFKNIYDFFERNDNKILNKKLLESLVQAGAFDSLIPNRHQMFASLATLSKYGQSYQDSQNSHQDFLFTATAETANRPHLADIDDWDLQQKLKGELNAIGFYLSAHPLEAYREHLPKFRATASSKAMQAESGQVFNMLGVCVALRKIRTRKNDKIAFIRMSDLHGFFEVTAYSQILASHHDLLQVQRLLCLKVRVKSRTDKDNILQLLEVSDLEEAMSKRDENIKIIVGDAATLADLSQIFKKHAKNGKGKVHLLLKNRQIDGAPVDIVINLKVNLQWTQPLIKAVKSLPGIVEVNPF